MSTPEQITAAKTAYDTALAAQQAAKAIVDSIKASSAATVSAYEQAKAAYDALKPSQALAKAKLQRAEADVTIARSEWQAVAPKEAAAEVAAKKGTGNAALLVAVNTFLADKPDGASNDDIYDGLIAAGVTMAGANPRDNLNSYLSRWGTAGSLVDKGLGKWAAKSAAPAAPSFLATPPAPVDPAPVVEAPVPSFIAPTEPAAPVTQVDADVLGEDFPGVEPLTEAGYTTRASLAGKTAEDLIQIAGIGAKTAAKIVEALAV